MKERKTNNPYRYHGLDLRSAEYRAWASMRAWAKTTGRKFYHKWESFPRFLKDMGARPSERHELRLVDRKGDYMPSNLEWRIHRVAFK